MRDVEAFDVLCQKAAGVNMDDPMEVIMGVMVGGTTAVILVFMMDSIMEDIMEEDILQCM